MPRWIRTVVAATAPVLVALAAQQFYFGPNARWELFFPAVFVASWFGGFASGVLAAVLTFGFVLWYVLPPVHTFYINPHEATVAAVFFAMSIIMSALQHHLRHTANDRLIFSALIDNSTDFIGISGPDGKAIYLNPAGKAKLGISQDSSIEERSVWDYYTEEARVHAREVVWPETMRNGFWQGETSFVNQKTGEIIPVWQSRLLIREPRSKRILGYGSISRDLTQMKELQKQRDEWTSIIAHDLRQPIGVITMAAGALPELHQGPMSDEEKTFTTRIVSAARGLARMVDDLLDISLLEAKRLELERRWIKPRELVDETLARLEYLTEGRTVTVTAADNVEDVYADPMRVGQVLGNLISNAVKYGDPGTPIEIDLGQRGNEVEIAVTNHGKGIVGEDLPHVFGRFKRFRTERRATKRGLGLGLYIAKELIEAHDGRIWVESTPGEKTTFHCRLPSRDKSSKAA